MLIPAPVDLLTTYISIIGLQSTGYNYNKFLYSFEQEERTCVA